MKMLDMFFKAAYVVMVLSAMAAAGILGIAWKAAAWLAAMAEEIDWRRVATVSLEGIGLVMAILVYPVYMLKEETE